MNVASGVIATQHAEKLVRDLSITALPVDPKAIAARHEILVQPKADTAPGVSGMLLQVGNSLGIMYATNLQNEGFENFSIGHELGHYFLPGHVDAIFDGGPVHESRAGFTSQDRYEAEADHFAAGLLMPKHLFIPAMKAAGKGVSAIERLSNECKTSLTATAIRMTQRTRDPIAVIVSTGSQIEYCFMSDALKELDDIDWIRKRQAVPHGTPTFEFNKDSANILGSARSTGAADLRDWFGGRRQIEVSEGVIGLGRYGKTLTILYDIELPDEEEEADEEALVESWTPRFRK